MVPYCPCLFPPSSSTAGLLSTSISLGNHPRSEQSRHQMQRKRRPIIKSGSFVLRMYYFPPVLLHAILCECESPKKDAIRMRKRGRETYENCWALSIPGLFVRELGDGLDVMRMAWPTTDAAADRRGLGNTRMRYGDGLCFFFFFCGLDRLLFIIFFA